MEDRNQGITNSDKFIESLDWNSKADDNFEHNIDFRMLDNVYINQDDDNWWDL